MSEPAPGLYGLVGHPVAHSRSPLIHRRFAAETGERLDYVLINIPPGGFVHGVGEFRDRGGLGLNVTLPYKGEALEYATELSERARRAQAVNTLAWREDGGVLGDNTDGAGLVRDIEHNLGFAIGGARVLLMGAGGAARGALPPLVDAVPREIVIANRTASRARRLAETGAGPVPVTGGGYGELEGPFDLVVNATSASLAGEVPALPDDAIGAATLCYDMMYEAGLTVFLRWARDRGAGGLADGTGMLVEQAAESFALWRGVRPDTAGALAEVRAALGAGAPGDGVQPNR